MNPSPINRFLLENNLRIASNPCVSPDFCLDWPALSAVLTAGGPAKTWTKSAFETAAGDWTLPVDQLERARLGRRGRERALRGALGTAFAVLSGPGGGAEPELAPPPVDEVVLTWFPGNTGLLAFVADTRATHVVRLADAAPERLLDAFDAAQPPPGDAVSKGPTGPKIRRIRVLPYGPVRGLDVHALPWRGRPLLAHAAVVYGLDLPAAPGSSARPAEPPTPPTLRRALVVSDPRGDLPGARTEADTVEFELPLKTLGNALDHVRDIGARGAPHHPRRRRVAARRDRHLVALDHRIDIVGEVQLEFAELALGGQHAACEGHLHARGHLDGVFAYP